eukprot:6184936-Pleurochrysis_carterae.AAC.7
MADRYLVALRDAMSIAWILNRTFVFPRFLCMCACSMCSTKRLQSVLIPQSALVPTASNKSPKVNGSCSSRLSHSSQIVLRLRMQVRSIRMARCYANLPVGEFGEPCMLCLREQKALRVPCVSCSPRLLRRTKSSS